MYHHWGCDQEVSLIFILAFTVICVACGSISGQGAQATLTEEAAEPETEPVAESGSTDLYAIETYDTVPDYYMERHDDVDYAVVETDVEYESSTAGDRKYCNVLLPAGYDESKEYLNEELAVPMIIVGVDMYTDILADKDNKAEEEMRLSYGELPIRII